MKTVKGLQAKAERLGEWGKQDATTCILSSKSEYPSNISDAGSAGSTTALTTVSGVPTASLQSTPKLKCTKCTPVEFRSHPANTGELRTSEQVDLYI
jgi:hypothetical protein